MSDKKYNYTDSSVFTEEGFITVPEDYPHTRQSKRSKAATKRIILCVVCVALAVLVMLTVLISQSGGNPLSFTEDNATALKTESRQKEAELAEIYSYTTKTAPWFSTDGYGRLFFDNSLFDGEELIVPSNFNNLSINTVSFGFDEKNTTVTKLTVQEGVRVIRESAFSKFTALEEVSLPSTIERVTGDCFHGTKWYKSLDDEFCTVGNDVLIKYCGNGGNVTIPDGIRVIDCAVFSGNTKASRIVFPKTALCVGSDVFDGCTAEEIVINDNLTAADNSSFFGSAWYEQQATPLIVGKGVLIKQEPENSVFEIPDGVLYVSGLRLDELDEYVTVRIGKDVTTIADMRTLGYAEGFSVSSENATYSTKSGVLYNREKTILCRFPIYRDTTVFRSRDDLTQISNYAFYGTSIKKVDLNDGITLIGNEAFSNCESLTEFVMPGTVSQLGHSVFKDCKSLESVQLSEVVKRIPRETFKNCTSLQKVQTGDYLTEIKEAAFFGCESLSSFTVTKNISSISDNAFEACGDFVPKIANGNIYFEIKDGKLSKRKIGR